MGSTAGLCSSHPCSPLSHVLQNLTIHCQGSPLSCPGCRPGAKVGVTDGSLTGPRTPTEQLSLVPAVERNQGQYSIQLRYPGPINGISVPSAVAPQVT